MAKKLVTENDLLSGVGGGFGNIAHMGSGRPVRDNPFRDTRTDSPPPAPAPSGEATQEPETSRPLGNTAPQPQPVLSVSRLTAPAAREASESTPPARPAPKARVTQRPRKRDTYSEKVSTFLGPEMRDDLEMVARRLNRNRLVKGESITVHTLIRSGVRVMTELLQFTDTDVVSSEEELTALVKRKLGR